jgi:aspartate carbamoyltransferase catalytic subunit
VHAQHAEPRHPRIAVPLSPAGDGLKPAPNRVIVGVGDLGTEEIRHILSRATSLRAGAASHLTRPPLLGLLFLEASLRTRVGFAAAAARLGGQSIDIAERRGNAVAMPEGWADTLRVVSGNVDLIVARPGRPLDASQLCPLLVSSFLNGGDAGRCGEHPSQALIDLYAIEQARGPVSELTVAICGDLRMRAVRSLVRLFARFPPRRLVAISDPRLADSDHGSDSSDDGSDSSDGHAELDAEHRAPWDVDDVDVLYVAGIPHGALDEPGRARLRVDRQALAALRPDAVVLSPMPVIDEIATTARSDPRIRMFQQSDDALFVRMALIEALLSPRVVL